jgi:hypothetical protein
MHSLKEFDARELPKSVGRDMFHARVIHQQDSASGPFLDLPCPFDTCCGDTRHASDRNAILVSR